MQSNPRPASSDELFDALRVLRVCWIVPILVFLTLAVPAQVRDLYRTVAENRNLGRIGVTALLLLLAAYLMYRTGRHRVRVYMASSQQDRPGLLLTWGPAFCSMLLLLAAAAGIYVAASEVPLPKGIDEEIDKTLLRMANARDELLIAAAVVAAVGALFLLLPLIDRWRRPAAEAPATFAFPPWQLALCLALAAGMVGLAFLPQLSVQVAQWLGSLAIFLLFLCLLLVALSALQSMSDWFGVPLIIALLVWVALLATFDRGGTHRARMVDTDTKGTGLIQLQYGLQDWYNERKDKDAYGSEPYPVYLIAAEGGGLYAAQFTANILARLQDLCPNFAQHVFAISSVSGGSLGASVFSSLAKKHAQNGPWQPCRVGSSEFQSKVHQILDQDFLAPIIARAFFADFAQLFIPYPLVVPQFSRGRALDETIEYAWSRAEGTADNPFAGAFLSHWYPGGVAPALLLNTTSVNDGRQIVISPLGSDGNVLFEAGQVHLMPGFPNNQDLTLGSAVSLSGRFPWILPVAMVADTGLAVVDGAYFEGSGVEALSFVRNALRPYEIKPTSPNDKDPYISVHVIVIGSGQPPVEALKTIDEITPPLRTMLRARERRGYVAFNNMRDLNMTVDCPATRPEDRLEKLLGGGSEVQCASKPPHVARLNYEYFKLPLGWHLSSGMRNIIDRHSEGRCFPRPQPGSPGAAEPAPNEDFERAREYLTQNSQLAVEIAGHLSAGKPGGDGGLKACD